MKSSVLDADTTGACSHTSAPPQSWPAEHHSDSRAAHGHPGREWAPALIPAALTFCVFLPLLGNGFVNWDDQANFLDNPHYRGFGWSSLRWMFTTAHLGHYIPVTWLTLALDYTVWGLNPAGYHLTSTLLHAVNALLVYRLASSLLTAAGPGTSAAWDIRLGAMAAALVFALHPQRVESVAWATERRDVTMGFFALLTVLAYLRAVRESVEGRLNRRWYWASVGLFAMALLSKSLVIGLPLVLFVLDLYPLRRRPAAHPRGLGRAVWLGFIEKWPFLALSGAVGVLMLALGAHRGNMTALDALSLGQRLAITAYGLVFYLWKAVIPWPLSPLYTLFHPVVPWDLVYLVPMVMVTIVTGILIAARRRWPAGLAAWIVYVVLVLPVSGLFHNGPQITADRYTYAASMSWALLVGAGVVWCGGAARNHRLSRPLAHGLLVALLLLLLGWSALGIRQEGIWHDSVALWSRAALVEPESDIPIFYLGWSLADAGRFDEARAHFARALARTPDSLPALKAQLLLHVGVIEQRAGHRAAAQASFRQALAVEPEHPVALIRLGTALLHGQESAEAQRLLERAAEVGARWGAYDAGELRVAVAQVPPEAGAVRGRLAHTMAGVLRRHGQLEEALEHYRLAAELLPANAAAWNDLGVAYALLGRNSEALEAFVFALRVSPSSRDACDNLRRVASTLATAPPELVACSKRSP
jgi:Flp pilus assembly protein TadD